MLMMTTIRHHQNMIIKFLTKLLTRVVITKKRKMRASRADIVIYLKDMGGQ